MRTCRECNETKPEELFTFNKRNGIIKFRNTCKACKNKADRVRYSPEYKIAMQNKWKKENPEKALLAQRRGNWKRLGINPDEAEKLWLTHVGKCGLCKEDIKGNANVDHCHETGKVRDILCRDCNLGLGNFKDSPELLLLAFQYLNSHKS